MKPSFTKSWTVILTLLALAFSAIGVTPAYADSTIIVNSTADNTTPDSSCTLREAIANADNNAATHAECIAGSGNDTILFHSSLGTATITLGSQLPTIADGAGLTIDGNNRITLSGNNSVRVFNVTGGGALTLQNISVTDGGVTNGSGLRNSSGGTVTITHSVFSNNRFGSGVENWGTLTILRSAFLNNTATTDGGGVWNSGTLTIANSTFSNNSANYGGGVMNNSGTATILNSTFSGNTASTGGGVATYKGGSTAPKTTIRNTILANNAIDSDCWNHEAGGGILIGGNNIIETTSTCASIATLTSDPNLGSLTGSPAYFPLTAGSPAIDAGDDTICAATPVSNKSQNGVTRPQDGNGDNTAVCDIGSYEAPDTFPPNVISITRLGTNPTNSDGVDFTVTFSEPVTGVDPTDFSLTTTGGIGGAFVAGLVVLGPTGYDVAVNSGTGDGAIRLDLKASGTGIQDLAGNPISGGFTGGESYTIDKTAPTVTMTSLASDPTHSSPILVTVQFSETVTGFSVGDILPGNGAVGNFTVVDGDTYTFDLTPSAPGLVTADIAADVATDLAGNGNTVATQFSRTYTMYNLFLPLILR